MLKLGAISGGRSQKDGKYRVLRWKGAAHNPRQTAFTLFPEAPVGADPPMLELSPRFRR
jgi:hypothetical protein